MACYIVDHGFIFTCLMCVCVSWHLNFQWEKNTIQNVIVGSNVIFLLLTAIGVFVVVVVAILTWSSTDVCTGAWSNTINNSNQRQIAAFFCSLITWLSNNERSINILLDDGSKFWQTVVTVNVFFLFVCLVIVCYCYWNIQKKKNKEMHHKRKNNKQSKITLFFQLNKQIQWLYIYIH